MKTAKLNKDLFHFDYDSFINEFDEDLKYEIDTKENIEKLISIAIENAIKKSITKAFEKGTVFKKHNFGGDKVWTTKNNHLLENEEFREDWAKENLEEIT